MKIKQAISSHALLSVLIAGSYLGVWRVFAIGRLNEYRRIDETLLILLLVLGIATGLMLFKFNKIEHKYLLLEDLGRQPAFFIDANNYDILAVNEAAEEKLGYSANEFLNLTIFELMQKEGDERVELENKIRKCIANRSSVTERTRHCQRNGQSISLEIIIQTTNKGRNDRLLVFVHDVTEMETLELKASKAIVEAQESERRLLGAELHDNVGQILLTTQLYLCMAINAKDRELERYLGEAKKLLIQSAIEVRNISHRIAPAFLDYIPLTDAISDLLKSINADNRFNIGFDFGHGVPCTSISSEIKLNIYRILQEQLKNILNYSEATEVKVRLTAEADRIHLVIADNGIGFDMKKFKPGIGLMNIRRRVEQFSGKFSINAAPQEGCCVTIEIPFLTDRAA